MDPGPVSSGRSSVAPQRSSAALQPERLAAEASRLASPDVLAGTYGGTIRRALADREAIVEIVAKLGKTDRELLPDVAPTVAALIDRIVSLGTAMHRLDGDATPEALQRLEARIATVEHEPPNAPDRERKLSLLQRQRQTLQDLVRRRETLLSQMESAALVLQNLKLDLVKLRSSGVQASIDDVTSATQEARALSRDIANVLDAAAEIRSI
jgi:serine/threonine-protein kinase